MLILIFIVIVCAELRSDMLDDYSNLNAKNVRETIKRGANYMVCMMEINSAIRCCVVSGSGVLDTPQGSNYGDPRQGLVRRTGTFQAPNKCFMSIESAGCSSFTTIKAVEKELKSSGFNITYAVVPNRSPLYMSGTTNMALAGFDAVKIIPKFMTISW